MEDRLHRAEAALQRIRHICEQIYQRSLEAEQAGYELDARTFAFALGACLGQVDEALGDGKSEDLDA